METLAQQLVANGLDVARDARLAHAEALRALDRHALAVEAAAVWQQIEHMTEVQQQVGLASALDLNAAQVDLHMAQVEAERTARGAELARVELVAVLGLDARAALPETVPSAVPARVPALDALFDLALAARPEVRAAELRIEAAAAQAGYERVKAYQLTAVLDANGEGKQGFEMGPGLQLPIPIFDHNQGGKAEAEAVVEQAAWNYLAVRQRVVSEVRAAFTRFTLARQALDRWPSEVVQPLEFGAEGAKKAFAAGGTSYLFVLDGARRLIAARVQTLELEAEVRRSAIQLARAVGKELDGPS
jgi:cobalt-zinc-cadmium efflux system outer membrane protein